MKVNDNIVQLHTIFCDVQIHLQSFQVPNSVQNMLCLNFFFCKTNSNFFFSSV